MSIQEHQREMQRKLGRCMLRLQQYERLLKTMVASMRIAGPLDQLEAVRDKQVLGVQDKTLGVLVGMFTGQHLAATSQGKELWSDEDTLSNDHGLNADTGRASTRFTISMSQSAICKQRWN